MEELLATIRRIVAEDDQPHAASPKIAPREPRLSTNETPPQSERALQRSHTQMRAPLDVQPPPADQLMEMEILELTEEFLVREDEHGHFAEGQQEEYEPPRTGREASPDLDRPPMAGGERRLWDDQPPIKTAPGPVAPEPAMPAPPPPLAEHQEKGVPQPQMSAHSHYAPRRPAPERERPPVRPAWSGRDLPPRPSAVGDHASRRAVPAATETAEEPAALWREPPENDAWPDNVQMPVPQSGPAAPFPMATSRPAAQPLQATKDTPEQEAPAEQPLARSYAAPPAASRIASPVTEDGAPARTPSPISRRAAPGAVTHEPETSAAPQYVQDMAQQFARAAIGGLDDRELAEASRSSFVAEKGAALAGVAESLAHALTERAVTRERTQAPADEAARGERSETVVGDQPAETPDRREQREAHPLADAEPRQGSLEESFKALLRPMLQEWLNENMPRLLEEAIAEEVKKRLGGG